MDYELVQDTKDHFYNCSESQCSSPIEILSLDNENIEFKCFNPKGSHQIKMELKEYLNIMKRHFNNENRSKFLIDGHYKENQSFCLTCNKNLCQICLESREHLSHNKIDIREVLPREKEITQVEKIINELQDKNEFKYLKDLFEIKFDIYKKYNKNYYFCINLNFILVNYIENNKSFKDKLSKEEYEHIIKIKKRKTELNNNEDIINYQKEIAELKEIINNYDLRKNIIQGELDIKLNEINDKIVLFNSDIKD